MAQCCSDSEKEESREIAIDEHKITLEELVQRYGTDLDRGLTPEKAHQVLQRDGPNRLTPPKRNPESVRNQIPEFATVIRNGEKLEVLAEQLVVGDVIEVKVGDRLPADIRVVQAEGLKVNNSQMSGESTPQTRSPEFTNANPLDTENLALFTAVVVQGKGRGIVFRTGDKMVMSSIVKLASSVF